MKAQSSIEFISLLSLALLGAAILVAAVNSHIYEFERSSSFEEAEDLAKSLAFRADYVVSQNASTRLEFPPDLRRNYTAQIGSGTVNVSFDSGYAAFPTLYEGSNVSFNLSESRVLNYSGGDLVVE